MRLLRAATLTATLLLASVAPAAMAQAPSAAGQVFATPIDLPTEQGLLKAEEGFIAVPENRADPDSRLILVNYLRIFARNPAPGRAPVVQLSGGPGDLTDRRDFVKTWYPKVQFKKTMWRYAENRDIVMVNQRGNHWVLGPFGGFEAPRPDLPPAPSKKAVSEAWTKSLRETFARLEARGVDLEGYDILNSAADVDDTRKALGYDKIIPYGFSFGSQLSLAYIRLYPEHTARALISGVEPLDYGYDSPGDLWNGLQRVAKDAEASPIAGQLPKIGLLKAVEVVLQRLRAQPAIVEIQDDQGKPIRVTVTAEDFQSAMVAPIKPHRGIRLTEHVAAWPKFVTELYNGDHRYLAKRKLQGLSGFGGTINLPLIDHSLGISDARDAKLKAEKAVAILGDPNDHYRRWAPITPTVEVSDDFRLFRPIDAPVLMVQGDMDFQTPWENARDQEPWLRNGALVTIHRGTHHTGYEIVEFLPELDRKLAEFIDLDMAPGADPEAFFASLPKDAQIPITYLPIDGPTLYEMPVD